MVDLLLVEYDSRNSLGVLPEARKSFTIEMYDLPVWYEYLLSFISSINLPIN